MSDLALSCRDLSKAYEISHASAGGRQYRTLRDDLRGLPRWLWQRLRRRRNETETLWALQDVSFDVGRGEVLGIIGRNGAGKSTLLKVLSRITDPTRGQVDLYGRVGSLLEVGTGFHPELTGRENIYLNGAILGMRRHEIARRFDEIVAFAEVEKFLDTPVKRFSSGMYMRLAFAVAAHLDPEIMVIDEVLAVGDAEFQKKCLGKMKEVGKSGRTVLFVSHNMNAVEALCDRAVLMESGRLRVDSRDVRSVIKTHLFGDDSASRFAKWENSGEFPSDGWCRPDSFSICDAKGIPLGMPVANSTDMWMRVELQIDQMDAAFNVGYAIYSEEGYLLYWSFFTDEEPARWPKFGVGPLTLMTRLPSRLLNEGDYRVELLASLHYRKWLLEPGVNAPSLFLNIRGGLSDSPLWMVRRPGLLAPVLPWLKREQLAR